MEKKTMGGFLAALRKANGMTQKDLAEQLNVSDKTVSRWERDEGVPDLSLIPVIAEIFGITCDELLRGERKSPEERLAPAPNESPKGEKQRRHLLAVSLSKYKTRSYIAMGLSVAGLIAAFVGNFGFLRAYIGFFVGAVFFLAAVICQAAFVNSAFLAVEDEGQADDAVNRYKRAVIRFAQVSFCLTAVLLFFCLPLMIFTQDTYAGLHASSWFLLGALFALIALAGCGGACMAVNSSLLKREVFTLTEKETQVWTHNRKWKKRCTLSLAVALVVTLVFQAVALEVWNASALAEPYIFYDVDAFVEFMGQDVPFSYSSGSISMTPVPDTQVESVAGERVYYDQYGNVISEEESLRAALTGQDDTVLCEYIDRNKSVVRIRHGGTKEDLLPISVITQDSLRMGQAKASVIQTAITLLYPIELLVVFVIYLRKRWKV